MFQRSCTRRTFGIASVTTMFVFCFALLLLDIGTGIRISLGVRAAPIQVDVEGRISRRGLETSLLMRPGDIRNTASGKLWACGDLEDDLEEEETGFGSAFGLETLQDALQDEIHQSWHGSLSPHDVTAFFDTSRGLASGVGVDTPSEILRSLWAKIIHYQSMVLNIYLPSLSLGLSFKGATGRSESGDGVGPIGMVKTRTEVEDKGEKDENLVEGLKYNKMEMTLDAVRKLLVLFDDILY